MTTEPFLGFSPQVHSSAWVHPSAHLIGDVIVDEDASIWPTVILRGDCGQIRIGRRSNIQDATVAHGTRGWSTISVGDECTIGHRALLHGCIVGHRCLIGMGSILLDNAEIGHDSFVAAGTLVPPGKVFEPRSFILGSPAKRVREVSSHDLEVIEISIQTYLDLMRSYRG